MSRETDSIQASGGRQPSENVAKESHSEGSHPPLAESQDTPIAEQSATVADDAMPRAEFVRKCIECVGVLRGDPALQHLFGVMNYDQERSSALAAAEIGLSLPSDDTDRAMYVCYLIEAIGLEVVQLHSDGELASLVPSSQTKPADSMLQMCLAELRGDLEAIVVPDGIDSGVILKSSESPTKYDPEKQANVFLYMHFSELGDALVALWEKLVLIEQQMSEPKT